MQEGAGAGPGWKQVVSCYECQEFQERCGYLPPTFTSVVWLFRSFRLCRERRYLGLFYISAHVHSGK